jgi:ATP-dependent exoDNAse (exonuclease V) alpha subunit
MKLKKPRKKKLDLNPQFQRALDLMENTDQALFITGKAGTGKSTLLSHWRGLTKKQIAVLAPTGVAALNVKGLTIHSFFGFTPEVTIDRIKKIYGEKEELYKGLDAIVIDEVSMVRADLLDCIDKFLRINGPDHLAPFGGVQMIFFGDLYQLPPVISREEAELFAESYPSPYFFSAQAMADLPMEYIELDHIYRQKDPMFIELLNAVRNNSVTNEHINQLNTRYQPHHQLADDDFTITLTSTNDLASTINESRLDRLTGETYRYQSRLTGEFERRSLPTDTILQLKIGAQVMLLNNDSEKRWVNGSIGKIVDILPDEVEDELFSYDTLIVELANGKEVEVLPYTWEMYEMRLDKAKEKLVTDVTGSFTQYPLRLAWAVTIHKSQGKTFDNAVIDVGRGTFAHGQMYVALSRCTSFEGLVLKQQLQRRHIQMDRRVVSYITNYQYKLAEEALPMEEKIELLQQAIENSSPLEVVYLKANDERSVRIIEPKKLVERSYAGMPFLGLDAFCRDRDELRVFRVDRMIAIKSLS